MWSKFFGETKRRLTYRTKSLYEAAFLASQGAKLLKFERQHQGLIFVLRVAQAQQAVLDAVLSEAEVSVNIRRFSAAVSRLERRVARWQRR